jgi:hypothetical protein
MGKSRKQLLKQYIGLVVSEQRDARVPNQLIAVDDGHTEQQADDESTGIVGEFAAVGGGNAVGTGNISGVTAPLGTGHGKYVKANHRTDLHKRKKRQK